MAFFKGTSSARSAKLPDISKNPDFSNPPDFS